MVGKICIKMQSIHGIRRTPCSHVRVTLAAFHRASCCLLPCLLRIYNQCVPPPCFQYFFLDILPMSIGGASTSV